jgi:hypothetical protein
MILTERPWLNLGEGSSFLISGDLSLSYIRSIDLNRVRNENATNVHRVDSLSPKFFWFLKVHGNTRSSLFGREKIGMSQTAKTTSGLIGSRLGVSALINAPGLENCERVSIRIDRIVRPWSTEAIYAD